MDLTIPEIIPLGGAINGKKDSTRPESSCTPVRFCMARGRTMQCLMICGVAGVGKSTLIKRIAAALHLPHGDYGDLMLGAMRSEYKYDIDSLTWDKRQAIYRQVDQTIKEMFRPIPNDDSLFILENHITVIQDLAIKTFHPSSFAIYRLRGICLIEAPAPVIYERRKCDLTRNRIDESSHLISAQQTENRHRANEISRCYQAPLTIVENTDIDMAVEEACRWISALAPNHKT